MQLEIPDVAAMEVLAAQVARQVTPGLMIFLQGPLGAGKTTFVRGFMRQLGYQGIVKSPTYTLVEPYYAAGDTSLTIYHFDLYRLASPQELEDIGVRDYLEQSAICLVEWPEKAGALLGSADLEIRIAMSEKDSGKRHLSLQSHSLAGETISRSLPGRG